MAGIGQIASFASISFSYLERSLRNGSLSNSVPLVNVF
jgi:hypothetical protein